MFDGKWIGTCSVDNPKENHLTFARTLAHLDKIRNVEFKLGVCIPVTLDYGWKHPWITIFPSEWFEYEFALFHNEINQYNSYLNTIEVDDSDIHFTVVPCEGIREVNGPKGKKIHLLHIGNIQVGRDVRIGPYTFIERAVFDSTIIEDGVRIDGHCAIGHNSVIGENTVIASGVGVGGSAIIGKNCWIGGNSYIRNGIKICDGTVIGCMSAVVKDITEPGVYAGVPARFIKPAEKNWNF